MRIKKAMLMIISLMTILSLSSCGKTDNTEQIGKTDNNTLHFLEGAGELINEALKPDPNDVESYLNRILKDNSFDESVTYDQLMRTPDDYEGTPVTFCGTIVQVLEGDDFTQYRFAVDGDYNQIILLESYSGYPIDTVIENDYVKIYGAAWGKYTYTALMGNEITVPLVLTAKMELSEMPIPTLPEYPTGPLTLKEYYSFSGDLQSTTEIESFEITNAEKSYSGDLNITCQVIGTVTGSDYLNINVSVKTSSDLQ